MHLPFAGRLRDMRSADSSFCSFLLLRSAGQWLALLFLPLFLMIAPSLHAQFGGSLNGTVTDTSGAVISGATVTLANPAGGKNH